jgi:predicted metal-dependent peptidase
VSAEEQAKARRAQGRVMLAVERIASRYPFHAALVSRFKVEPRPSISTMAVSAAEDAVRLMHNPDFVLGLPMAELGGVLLHEVHHVLFGHLTMDPKDYPDRFALTVAEEVTANEFIREPLPGSPVLLKYFPQLPPGESTEERYHRLFDPNRPTTKVATTLDDHGPWQEGEQTTEAIMEAVQEAAAAVDVSALPKEVREAIGKLAGPGSVAALESLQASQKGSVDWTTQLRRYAGQVLEVRPVYTRPPRRFPEMVGIIPCQARQACRPKVLAVIDTSGSITPELLTQINGELTQLAKRHTVTVCECDCAIHRVYPYKPLTSVCGRGGTDLRPPLERDFLRTHKPDVIVYFTDGYGQAPDRSPGVPVIWCLLPGGRVPAPWGRVVWTNPPSLGRKSG